MNNRHERQGLGKISGSAGPVKRITEAIASDGTVFRVGDVLPPKRRKLVVRPTFTGAGAPSFKPGRNGKK